MNFLFISIVSNTWHGTQHTAKHSVKLVEDLWRRQEKERVGQMEKAALKCIHYHM